MDTLIKNGHVIDPTNNISGVYDIGIKNGMILQIGENIPVTQKTNLIDAQNLWVVPGFIDLHVHLREPGQTHKEDIISGSHAAVAGGFTTICAMPNTSPIQDNPSLIQSLYQKARDAYCQVLFVGAITIGQGGAYLTDFNALKKAGVIALSEDGRSVASANLFRNALIEATKTGLIILDHCEEATMDGGALHESDLSRKWELPPVLRMAEDLLTSRDILLALDVDAPLHICHVSTKGSVSMIRAAKALSTRITAEVTPHHFTLTMDDIKTQDSNFKMSPPLREKSDIKAVLEGLKDGTIEVIATDHAPHHMDEKNVPFENAPNGIVGLETALPLSLDALYHTNILTKEALIKKLTHNPAKILGINKGHLSLGHTADITIIDPNERYIIDKEKFFSTSKNTPFHGRKVRGKVKMTFVGGNMVYDDRNEKEGVLHD